MTVAQSIQMFLPNCDDSELHALMHGLLITYNKQWNILPKYDIAEIWIHVLAKDELQQKMRKLQQKGELITTKDELQQSKDKLQQKMSYNKDTTAIII